MNHKIIVPAILLAGTAALAFFDASAQEEALGTDVGINANRNMTSIQMANGVAYQCIRDHNQCLRTIPNSTLWNSAAYEIELQSCCLEIAACGIFANSVRGGSGITHLNDYVETACPTDDATGIGEARRLPLLEGVRASRE
ncbi:MAG: hypothetical protein OXP28_02590 [Gammaproteobacteria bacterium]|nr:hypothetical protein [Gammaproteobacteria bacterium]